MTAFPFSEVNAFDTNKRRVHISELTLGQHMHHEIMDGSNHGPTYQRHSGTVYQSVENRTPWQTGSFRRLPFLGLLSLLGAIVGIVACAAVLVYSNGMPITIWTFQPTVYLAITATLINIFIAYALSEGADITWWRKAGQETTTIGDLHRTWAQGKGFKEALFAGRQMSLLAAACVFATLAQINSPLLQRASSVEIGTVSANTTVSFYGAPTVPYKFTGYFSGRAMTPLSYTPVFQPIVASWSNGDPIPANNTGCIGMCYTQVKAAGLAVNCSTSTTPWSNYPAMNASGQIDWNNASWLQGANIFVSNVTFGGAMNQGNMTFVSIYKNKIGCSGDLMVETCTVQTATMVYPVVIDGNKSTIALVPNTTVFDDELDSLWYPELQSFWGVSTMAGFFVALSSRYDSTANTRFTGAAGNTLVFTGTEVLSHITYANATMGYYQYDQNCTILFTSGMSKMLEGARDLMFRTSVAAASLNTTIPVQKVQARQTGDHAIYKSNYYYLIGAAAITLLAIILVVITFRGYSDLGRAISLSPIETAKAFSAPMLQNHDGNAEVDDLIHEIGRRSVRYGAVAEHAREGHGLAATAAAATAAESDYNIPSMNVNTEYKPHDPFIHEVGPRRRLAMADAHLVAKPNKGEMFTG